MFSHLLIYRLKMQLRNRALVFWTLIFPFILATIYQLVFSGMSGSVHFSPIPVAVVDNEAYQSAANFRQALSAVSSGEAPLLELLESPDEVTAQLWLKEKKVRGYITFADPIQWHVSRSGLGQSMVKSFLDQYAQLDQAVQTILSQNPSAMTEMIKQLGEGQKIVTQAQVSRSNADVILILYYALLAMSCMNGAFYGLSLVLSIQGNLSTRAARVNLAPLHKLRMFMAGMVASFVVHIMGLLLFLAYLRWILGVNFGGQGFLVVATTILGSIMGLSFGALVGLALKGKESLKEVSLSGIIMLGSFLAGMMSPQVKYQIANAMPLLSWINPVNLLADAFYALYYYDDYHRYGQNMGLLLLFSLLLWAVVFTLIRRRQYVSL